MSSQTISTGQSDGPELADYGATLWRRKWLILACVALALVAAAVFTRAQEKTYTSSASVYVTPIVVDTFSGNLRGDQLVNLDTEAQLVRSAVVADRARTLGALPGTTGELVRSLEVTVPANTQVLQIEVGQPTPRRAQVAAEAFANAYLAYRTEDATGRRDGRLTNLSAQVAAVERELQDLSGRLISLPTTSPDRAFLQARQSVLTDELTTLRTQIGNLTSLRIEPGRLIQAAPLPTDATRPIVPLNLGVGLVLGLLAGLLLAALRERTDRRLRRPVDVARAAGAPVLADVPPSGRGAAGGVLPALSGPQAEAHARLRNALNATLASHASPVVVVTAAGKGTGATITALNLANAMAQSGSRVVLVSGDADGHSVSAVLNVRTDRSLQDVLDGRITPAEAVQQTPLRSGLGLLASREGGTPIGINTRAARDLLTALRSSYDVVVVQAPPTGRGADAQAWAGLADAVVLVVQAQRTTRDEVAEAREQFERVGAALAGTVLLHGDPPRLPSGGAGDAGPIADVPSPQDGATDATTPGAAPTGVGAQPHGSTQLDSTLDNARQQVRSGARDA